MLIGVMSDSHNSRNNLKKAIELMNERKCEVLVHCGDYTSPSVLNEFFSFKGNVYGVFGNMDSDISSMKAIAGDCITFMGLEGYLELDGKKIAFSHYPDKARNFARTGNYDIVFYGHTHKYDIDMTYKTPVINPGDIAGRYGRSTFILYDPSTGEVEKVDIGDL